MLHGDLGCELDYDGMLRGCPSRFPHRDFQNRSVVPLSPSRPVRPTLSEPTTEKLQPRMQLSADFLSARIL